MFRFGCSPDDYFRYEFYRKSNFEKNKFITYRTSKRIIKKYNDPEKVGKRQIASTLTFLGGCLAATNI